MNYIVASTAVTDEIRFTAGGGTDGKEAVVQAVEQIAGGAGIYALCGIKLWSDDVLLVTGVGRDFPKLYGTWFRENGISMDGLIYKDEKTPHNIMVYFEDGERSETPLYGADHYKQVEVAPEELEPYIGTAKGVYIFRNHNPEFWEKILAAKQQSPAKIMWEIANDATKPEHLEEVRSIAVCLDVFSINVTEACKLLGMDTAKPVEEVAGMLQGWGIPLVFLRRGSKGALMITPDEIVEVPTVRDVLAVDPTGGGNSSSGAVLYGYCCGFTPEECGLMGSISAAQCLEQYGVPEVFDEGRRAAARKLLEKMKGNSYHEK